MPYYLKCSNPKSCQQDFLSKVTKDLRVCFASVLLFFVFQTIKSAQIRLLFEVFFRLRLLEKTAWRAKKLVGVFPSKMSAHTLALETLNASAVPNVDWHVTLFVPSVPRPEPTRSFVFLLGCCL